MILGEQMEFACWNQWEELYLKGQAPSGCSVLVSSLRLSLWSHSLLLGLALTYLPMR